MDIKKLYVEKIEYKYNIKEKYFTLIDKDKKRFIFNYKNIKKVLNFNISNFELIFLFLGVLISIQIWIGLTALLSIYLFLRWNISRYILIIQEKGNVFMSFDTSKNKKDFLEELCTQEERLCRSVLKFWKKDKK